jgi:hypothetical protein
LKNKLLVFILILCFHFDSQGAHPFWNEIIGLYNPENNQNAKKTCSKIGFKIKDTIEGCKLVCQNVSYVYRIPSIEGYDIEWTLISEGFSSFSNNAKSINGTHAIVTFQFDEMEDEDILRAQYIPIDPDKCLSEFMQITIKRKNLEDLT